MLTMCLCLFLVLIVWFVCTLGVTLFGLTVDYVCFLFGFTWDGDFVVV